MQMDAGVHCTGERKRQNNIEMKRMIVDTQAERQTCKRTDRCSDGEREREREREREIVSQKDNEMNER